MHPKMHWVCGSWVVVFPLRITVRVTPEVLDYGARRGSADYRSGTEGWGIRVGRVGDGCEGRVIGRHCPAIPASDLAILGV